MIRLLRSPLVLLAALLCAGAGVPAALAQSPTATAGRTSAPVAPGVRKATRPARSSASRKATRPTTASKGVTPASASVKVADCATPAAPAATVAAKDKAAPGPTGAGRAAATATPVAVASVDLFAPAVAPCANAGSSKH